MIDVVHFRLLVTHMGYPSHVMLKEANSSCLVKERFVVMSSLT